VDDAKDSRRSVRPSEGTSVRGPEQQQQQQQPPQRHGGLPNQQPSAAVAAPQPAMVGAGLYGQFMPPGYTTLADRVGSAPFATLVDREATQLLLGHRAPSGFAWTDLVSSRARGLCVCVFVCVCV
jgi:hypothetical protein